MKPLSRPAARTTSTSVTSCHVDERLEQTVDAREDANPLDGSDRLFAELRLLGLMEVRVRVIRRELERGERGTTLGPGECERPRRGEAGGPPFGNRCVEPRHARVGIQWMAREADPIATHEAVYDGVRGSGKNVHLELGARDGGHLDLHRLHARSEADEVRLLLPVEPLRDGIGIDLDRFARVEALSCLVHQRGALLPLERIQARPKTDIGSSIRTALPRLWLARGDSIRLGRCST